MLVQIFTPSLSECLADHAAIAAQADQRTTQHQTKFRFVHALLLYFEDLCLFLL